MITISFNGESRELDGPLMIAELLERLDYRAGSVAVAVNGAFVARSAYAHTPIADGDRVDVVAPMQGGC